MTTDPAAIAARKRKLRRRHKRERQAVIFGGVLAGLAALGLGAAAVWTGSMDSPIEREWTTVSESPSDPVIAVPCVPADTLPVAYGDVAVNVFNATSKAGLAGSVADLLGQRGFEIASTDNFPIKLRGVGRIGFGAQGVAAAYTLYAHVPGVALVYDARTDATVDLAVGSGYTQLEDLDLVPLAADEPLKPMNGCVPLAEAEPQPAPTRTAVADDAEAGSDTDEDEGAAQDDVEGEDGTEG
ncbi:MAG: LytR C-terminal domain-containing protein [Actinomycetota bacterium]|nr:LytR C-terminal domain-containing protein [Actinomycetota bacterium]